MIANAAKTDPGPETVDELAQTVCEAHGLELVEVRRLSQRGAVVLRVTIDRPSHSEASPDSGRLSDGSGVTLRDCEAISRDLAVALDVHEEVVPTRYHLEVSSPGLERPLVKEKDYERFAGREAKVKTRTPVDGRRNFLGTLRGISAGCVRLEVDGDRVDLPLDAVARAHLVHRF